MLYKETVFPSTLELLIKLMRDDTFREFVLVGGTALSLQLGHRISIDLDLFTFSSFDESSLSAYLVSNYNLELDFLAKNTIRGEIAGIQIDCITHPYSWIHSFVVEDNIRLANLYDIAAMKLNAISNNGTRIKDFIDLAFLSSKITFSEMLKAYEQKYHSNPIIPLKSITFFDDINLNEPIKMINSPFKWKQIAKRLFEMQQNPNRIFPELQ